MVGNSGRVAKVLHNLTPKLLGNVMSKLMQAYFKNGAVDALNTTGSLFKTSGIGTGISGGWKKIHPLLSSFKR